MSQPALKIELIKFQIEVTSGSSKGQRFDFQADTIKVGRGPENDIVLIDPKVSRHHFDIQQINGNLFVTLQSPKNYLLIDGEKNPSGPVNNGSSITAGDSVLKISFTPPPSASIPAPQKKVTLEPLPSVADFPLEIKSHAPQSYQAATPQPVASTPPSNSYMQNAPLPPRRQKPAMNMNAPSLSPKALLYLVVGMVLVGGYFYMNEGPKNGKTPLEIRSTEQIQNDLLRSQQAVEAVKRQKSANNIESKQYENAQQYYVKGFRDYKQGQYARAIQSLQAALSFYPQHPLARKYLDLSRRKMDEFVQYNMLQGRRYKDRGNYRLCQSSFRNVLVSVMDPNNKTYIEAKQLYDECMALSGERY